MRRALFASLILGLLAGCVGLKVDAFPPARRPEGVGINGSTTRQGSFTGELLEVRDAGLLLLLVPPATATTKRLVLLPYGAIHEARCDRLGTHYELRDGQPPTAATRERLQRVSRFPQGLSDPVLRTLLDAYGQPEIEQVPE